MNTDFLKLIRLKVTILVGLSAFAGTCLFSPSAGKNHLYGVLAAVLLAAGCSALNQWQERQEDSLMERTKDRPLPSGRMKPEEALMFAVILLAVAFTLIIRMKNIPLLASGIAAVAVYNFLYTPMKKKTPFALMTGSVSGALPPVIGFLAAGGSPADMRIFVVAGILYIWQTPHFALLSFKYADDYAKAGFKTLTGTFGEIKTRKFINVWMSGYATSLFFAIPAGIYLHQPVYFIHAFVAAGTYILFFRFRADTDKAFMILNISIALFFMLLIADRMFSLI
ncbi:protoheme IX farnesyltransferase [Geovibrio thiophilus]|uniref:Protoheme IX farnesyltransferase n=1 Tax=Geovibrio thiophilus TaxID=139438 RepID=A0A3R5UX37_9BACT|nr:protoheme IX farnesyltransferase [Geovibrio thiophilus]QAR32594.1 protoheme IX farnesyltransferase [Geovibrio thiophilus]